MNLLSRFRSRRPLPVPVDMIAVLEPMYDDGDGGSVALTGYPTYMGTWTGQDGIRYTRLRLGFGPDAHVIIRTPSVRWCAQAAEAFMAACDDLNPLPAGMEEQR